MSWYCHQQFLSPPSSATDKLPAPFYKSMACMRVPRIQRHSPILRSITDLLPSLCVKGTLCRNCATLSQKWRDAEGLQRSLAWCRDSPRILLHSTPRWPQHLTQQMCLRCLPGICLYLTGVPCVEEVDLIPLGISSKGSSYFSNGSTKGLSNNDHQQHDQEII